MRYTFFALLFILSGIAQAEAQSVFDNLPPVVIEGTPPAADEEPAQPGQVEDVSPQPAPEPYTVSNVKADVTADTAAP
ncbi:MAG: hypothetical protein PHE27_05060, partial [Alphaproteobacteria bacterium]|nr:hypothetical protein [Alphaproteobacteria bacterium]